MNKSQTTCDHCGADLTDTEKQPRYRLCLSAERLPHTSNLVNAVHVEPPIDRTHHFCGVPCLEQWLGTRKPRAVATAQSGTVSSVIVGGPGYKTGPDGAITELTLTNPGPPGGTAVWDALKRIEPVWDADKQEWKAMPAPGA